MTYAIIFGVFVSYSLVLSFALSRAGFRNGAPVEGREAPAERPAKVLIIGATGGTGRELVGQALERGYAVTALVRDPAKLKIEHSQLRVLKGDVLDRGSIDAAMKGHDAVVSALGHKRFFYPNRILSDGTANILGAMSTSGVRRIVCQTSLGIGDSAGRMGIYYTFFTIPLILPLYFWDKTRQEQCISESHTEWVIVRPGLLYNAKPRGSFKHGRHIGSFLWTVRIARADVAAFMLDQLETNTYVWTAAGVA